MTPAPFPTSSVAPLRVVILSCGDLGDEVAMRLGADPAVVVAAVVTAPWVGKRLSFTGKLRHIVRTQGYRGLVHVLAAKLRPAPRDEQPHSSRPDFPANISQIRVDNFHSPDALTAIAGLDVDLGVVAGTYILRDSVFDIPKYGSINLHSGKAPEYRGAAPAFWELYNGETAVGITIHRVAAALDAGHILTQQLFPLDPRPSEDPLDYVERYRREVLRPNGVRLVAEAVSAIAHGRAEPVPQDSSRAQTYRSPDFAAIKELRKRVRARRGKP